MSLTTLRTVCSISSSAPGAQPPLSPQRSGSYIGLQRISPASTTRWVVVRVSQATRDSGSFDRNRSTIASEIWSDTLSGWPSETLSDVNRYSARMLPFPVARRSSLDAIRGSAMAANYIAFVVEPEFTVLAQHRAGRFEISGPGHRRRHALVVHLRNVDRRVPRSEQSRGADPRAFAVQLVWQGVHFVAEQRPRVGQWIEREVLRLVAERRSRSLDQLVA